MPPATVSELTNNLAAQTAKIREICDISGVAGASITVIKHGATVFELNLGYRNLNKKEPVTSDTLFQIGSLTKSFTGACIHALRSKGDLKLKDPIQKHLPEAKSRDPIVASEATIADLLGHRACLQKANEIWLGAEGEILIAKNQTQAVFRNLQPQAGLGFRSQFSYNNIGWAILGEIIEAIVGKPYHVHLKETILDPQGMTNTLVTNDHDLPENTSQAYSTLDNGDTHQVPRFSGSVNDMMGASGGLVSNVKDLAKWCKALMRAWRDKANRQKDDPILGDVSWLFAPLQILQFPSFREKSYTAGGWVRSQLPGTVGTLGVNPGLVDEMPVLADGLTESPLAIWNQGSLVGATSFVMMLPETQSAVLVLTNTMAPNDAADWIGQLLVETFLDSPVRNDYVHLASVSAARALEKYAELGKVIEKGRVSGGPTRGLNEYLGSYVGFGGLFRIDVRLQEGGQDLEMLLQGRETQKYRLQHHHADTFTWFMSWNEQIKMARFINYQSEFYFVRFESRGDKVITALNWVYDAGVPGGEDFVRVRA
ncbi:Beta-lactamase/transpeptidase-like protein [Naviculisporaceae sp. PSN 640]